MNQPTPMRPDRLLEMTRDAVHRDTRPVTPHGKASGTNCRAVMLRDLTAHVGDGGTVFECDDPRRAVQALPMTDAFILTVRPDVVKGWSMHETRDAPDALISARRDFVLDDMRPDSPACGGLQTISLADDARKPVTSPAIVWHADHKWGDPETLVVNFPPRHGHLAPDQTRPPIDTDPVRHDFGAHARG